MHTTNRVPPAARCVALDSRVDNGETGAGMGIQFYLRRAAR